MVFEIITIRQFLKEFFATPCIFYKDIFDDLKEHHEEMVFCLLMQFFFQSFTSFFKLSLIIKSSDATIN